MDQKMMTEVWDSLTYEQKNRELFERQKHSLDEFLEHGAISTQQYEKSLHDLTEKMGTKEYLDIVDESGYPTGEIISRDVAHTEGILHRTAHVWVVRKTDRGYDILLQKRSEEKESFPGLYDTSSAGHISAGEEPLESALRELKEELGITASENELRYTGSFRIQYEKEFHGRMFRDNEVTWVYVYEKIVDISTLKLQESEVSEVRWFDLDEVWNEIRTDRSRFCVPTGGLMVLVFLRMFFASLVLLPWSVFQNREEWAALTRRELLLCILAGIFLAIHFTLYFTAVRFTSIASAVLLVDVEVFFVALASPLLLNRRVTGQGWIGIILTFLGSIIIAFSGGRQGANVLLGDALALAGAACMAVYTLIGAEVRKTRSTILYTTIVYTTGAAVVGAMLIITGTPLPGYTISDYLAGAGLALFCTLLGHSVFSWGLKYESPAYVSTVKLLEPVFATIMGVVFFGELPTWQIVLGGMIVIFGIAWYSFRGEQTGG